MSVTCDLTRVDFVMMMLTQPAHLPATQTPLFPKVQREPKPKLKRQKQGAEVEVEAKERQLDTTNTLTQEWVVFRTMVTPHWLGNKSQQGHISMGLDLLHDVLVQLFQTTTLSRLCNPPNEAAFYTKVAAALKHVLAIRMPDVHSKPEQPPPETTPTTATTTSTARPTQTTQTTQEFTTTPSTAATTPLTTTWKRGTCGHAVRMMLQILRKIRCPVPILRALRLPVSKKPWNPMLGMVGRLPSEHPARKRMELWLSALQSHPRRRMASSLRNILQFYKREFLPMCGLDVHENREWGPVELQKILDSAQDRNTMEDVCRGDRVRRYWVSLFLGTVLRRRDIQVSVIEEVAREANMDKYDGDRHRISAENLDKLQKVAVQNAEDELFFMTLLTTGMRIGGYVNIKSVDVAELVEGRWRARKQGKTTEKGCKTFTFLLHPRVQFLIEDWLNRGRGYCTSEYLFPGKYDGPRSTAFFRQRFHRVCAQADLKGPEFHPHALRHCYAHILLESGNSVETVTKLINHSSTAVTQRHYLRESSAEVAQRSIIPWLPRAEAEKNTQDHVPKFLTSRDHSQRTAISHLKEFIKI